MDDNEDEKPADSVHHEKVTEKHDGVQEQELTTHREQEPKVSKRHRYGLYFGGGIAIVVIAAGLGGWAYYNHHQVVQFNSYVQAAQTALNDNNYGLAITDYNKALAYENSPTIQAQLNNVQQLSNEHNAYAAGENAYSNGNYTTASADLQKVKSNDVQDYTKAQATLKQIHNSLVVTNLMSDVSTLQTDSSNLTTTINDIASTENAITNDAFGSQALSSDINTLTSDNNTFSTQLNTLTSDINTFDTEMEYLSNANIMAIATSLSDAFNKTENDYSDMTTIVSENITNLQQQISNSASYGYTGSPVLSSSSTNQWNSDIKDSDNQSNNILASIAKLQAYASAGSSSSASSGSSA